MKLEFTETVKREVEVSLPCYRKSYCFYYFVDENKKTLRVGDLEDHPSIDISYVDFAFSSDSKESSKEEFEKVYSKVLNRLKF